MLVSGIVQGVGFRPFVYRIATHLSLTGYVKNRGDAGVEIVVEGKKENIDAFLRDLDRKKPDRAKIHGLSVNYTKSTGEFDCFKILKSSEERELTGSVIPADISICNECLAELRNPLNRRYNYFFITCTNCGPRFTIINRLPYDRPNTTMQAFSMCEKCLNEYQNPLDRRFHAQTNACPTCGPKVTLMTNKGEPLSLKDPIREAGRLLEEGYLVAMKGIGGFHISTSTVMDEPIIRLRRTKHRAQKPFAIMARNLECVKTFAEVNDKAVELLTSYVRPIVLLDKSPNFDLSEQIAPGLHNIGVMLPYTGLHEMLFDRVKERAFVMTSANPPDEPLIKDDEQAIKTLGSVVDYFLLHDRSIAHRCDDSVVKPLGDNIGIIRRSRGFSPEPIHLKNAFEGCILALGAELNATSCILLEDKAFLTQHIGDVETLSTYNHLRDATEHLLRLVGGKVSIVACDLHPRFQTTQLAKKISESLGLDLIQVQHHHAHAASLMGEYSVKEMVCIVCDGFGYGSDGSAWGGEILFCNQQGFQRVAHLSEQPMIGGDLATRFPLRMVAGILYGFPDVEEYLYSNSYRFPKGEREISIILKQAKSDGLKTTSCGRILDSVSALLGLCYERTYEGEPAMKLESAAKGGHNVLSLDPQIRGHILDTRPLLYEIFVRRSSYKVADLAYSAHYYLAQGLAQLAVDEAHRLSVKVVGFSGGVAYNEHMTSIIRDMVIKNGLKFLAHNQIPPGDGGISFGQAFSTALASN
ncbi:MAG: carbamoyltransferase HypF [Nitrososphaerales archaeon]